MGSLTPSLYVRESVLYVSPCIHDHPCIMQTIQHPTCCSQKASRKCEIRSSCKPVKYIYICIYIIYTQLYTRIIIMIMRTKTKSKEKRSPKANDFRFSPTKGRFPSSLVKVDSWPATRTSAALSTFSHFLTEFAGSSSSRGPTSIEKHV